jgi:endonuclease V-like protein UPF0215 family
LPIIRLRQVKKEIRLLGIYITKLTKGLQVVGVVFKGNKSLDGVITTHLVNEQDLTIHVSDMIKKSKHYNQIRVIIYDEETLPSASLDPFLLFESTEKPVLSLSKSDRLDERFMFKWKAWTIFSAGLGKKDALGVLDVSTREDNYPEVLRVANLVSKGLHNI